MEDLAVRACEAHAARGPAAAAELFLDAVAGPGTWAALSPRQREALGAAGDGVLADVMMPDLVPGALGRIAAQVILATGRASEPFYRPIAEALAARIPRARAVSLDGLRHPAPITDPDRVADTVRDLVVRLATPGEDAP
jgi:pimeloyl-ACP methyl ester carboxylesterase